LENTEPFAVLAITPLMKLQVLRVASEAQRVFAPSRSQTVA